MAYLRDDEAVERYKALEAELKILNAEITSFWRNSMVEVMRMFTLKQSLERRIEDLKSSCHLLQQQ